MKGERIVVVPWAPRPLIVPGDGQHRPGGLDEFVDELLEADVDERPRWFDVALLAGGAGVVVGGVAGTGSPDVVFTGAMAALLGSGSLARIAWRTLQRRRRARRRQDAAPALGLPLVATHPATEALIAAYQRVLEVGGRSGVAVPGREVAAAAHLAVVEVATVLDGAPPGREVEEEYVWERTRTVEALLRALERPQEAPPAAEDLVQAN